MFLRAIVPQEVILQIIDFLDGDGAALKACSLVSSSIRAHSQRHLFRSVTLDLRYPSQQVLLHQALMSNPALPDFVLHLQLLLVNSPVDEVCDVLRQLHNVRGVTLKLPTNTSHDDDDETSWDELHIQIRDFLARIICLPTCQSLSLGSRIYLPLNFVSRLTHLRHLQISDQTSFLIDQDVKLPMESYFQSSESEGFLESLIILNPTLIEPLRYLAPLSLSRLRVCHISSMSYFDDLQDLFNVCPLLERLHINIISPPYLDFSLLKHLQVVCINIVGGFAAGAWLTRILATLPSISQLELLSLSGEESLITEEQWSKIDHLLAQEDDRGTKMQPRVVWYLGDLRPEHGSSLKEKLPRLVEKGMLVLSSLRLIESRWNESSAPTPTWFRCTMCFPPL